MSMSYRNWLRSLEGLPPLPEKRDDCYDGSTIIGSGIDKMDDGREYRYEAWAESGYDIKK